MIHNSRCPVFSVTNTKFKTTSNQKAEGSKEGKTITLLQLENMHFSKDNLAKFSRGKIDLELNWLKKKTKPQKGGLDVC